MKNSNIISLENSLKRLESYIPYIEKSNSKISKANVAWQLDHSLKVFNGIATVLQESDPNLYVDNFSLMGKVLLQLNYIPRGKAKAPKYLASPEIILKEDLLTQLVLAKAHISAIEKLDKNAFFKHPLFGNVNHARAFRFLKVHTHHHLKIVKAILK
ncbi:DUF1569 domain-containing protein [Polaribacter sp.]|nr:DUF1569 domain-containing protein [Polaribacter sp.]